MAFRGRSLDGFLKTFNTEGTEVHRVGRAVRRLKAL